MFDKTSSPAGYVELRTFMDRAGYADAIKHKKSDAPPPAANALPAANDETANVYRKLVRSKSAFFRAKMLERHDPVLHSTKEPGTTNKLFWLLALVPTYRHYGMTLYIALYTSHCAGLHDLR